MDQPEWELSKENVAPLSSGRNVDVLTKALISSKEHLEVERARHEQNVRDSINGIGPHKDDPLAPYSVFAKWVIENYPAGSDLLVRVVEGACRRYAKEERYRDDIRFVRLWVRYIELRKDKLDVFNYMHRKRIGESWSLFYEAWAITLELARQYDRAEEVYRIGREKQAKPSERLAQREREYYSRMAARARREKKRQAEAEKKKLAEAEKDALRPDRESSRGSASLANSILFRQDNDVDSVLNQHQSQPVRPALGQITELQAQTGHRPFVTPGSLPKEIRRKRAPSEKAGSVSRPQGAEFEIFVDAVNKSAVVPRGEEDYNGDEGLISLPVLARRDDVHKEDEGRLPEKWAGVTLPQSGKAKDRLQRGGLVAVEKNTFEVFQDTDSDCRSDPIVKAAIEDVRALERKDAKAPNAQEPLCYQADLPTTDQEQDRKRKSPAPARDNVRNIGGGSPTINTKLALQEVDDMFNSSFPAELERENAISHFSVLKQESVEVSPVIDAGKIQVYKDFGADKENAERKEHDSLGILCPDDIPALSRRVLQPLPHLEGVPLDESGGQASAESWELTTNCDPNQEFSRAQQADATPDTTYDLGGFLAFWCMNEQDFQLLDGPDPQVEADGLFDLHWRISLSLNVDQFEWFGYRHHSRVFLVEDLNNDFGLIDDSLDPDNDEDDVAVLAIKISKSSNAWEFYIYRTIQARLSVSLQSVPRALAFCEGNPNSHLILAGTSTCSLNEVLLLLPQRLMPEALCMLFIVDLLKVLEALHRISVIHCDVTLDNALFRNSTNIRLSSSEYRATGECGWGGRGVLLVDYNHAIDTKHDRVGGVDMKAIAQHAGSLGNSYLHKDYRIPGAQMWAFNADCYAAAVCASKMLGITLSDVDASPVSLRHRNVWKTFFTDMCTLSAVATSQDTIAVMSRHRLAMEKILVTDEDLKTSMMRLSGEVLASSQRDMTVAL